jgi:hypothetical protein
MASLDADLQGIIADWNELPAAIKAAFVILVRSQSAWKE